MIDFEKKYRYRQGEVDVAHELVFKRARALAHAVKYFNDTVEQARWMERHRREIWTLEMSDGSVIRGRQAEATWQAFNSNDWDSIVDAVGTAKELEKYLEDAGIIIDMV